MDGGELGSGCVCRVVTWLETGEAPQTEHPPPGGFLLRTGMGLCAYASLFLFRFLGKLLPGLDARSAEAG